MDDRRGAVLRVEVIPAGDDGGDGEGQEGRRKGRAHDGIGDPGWAFPQRVIRNEDAFSPYFPSPKAALFKRIQLDS